MSTSSNGTRETALLSGGPAKAIFVSGSPTEMGLTYGREAREPIQKNVAIIKGWMEWLGTLGHRYDFYDVLAQNETFIKKESPETLEEIAGIAEGAGVEYHDILLINSPVFFVGAQLPQDCSQVLLMPPATNTGQTYLAKTRDIGGEWMNQSVIHRQYPDGQELIEVNTSGSITWPGSGISSNGVMLSTSGVWSKRTPINLDRADSGWVLVNGHELLRTCHTLDEIETQLRNQPRITGINMVATDGKFGAALETTADAVYRIDAEDGVVFRSNHFFHPDIQTVSPTADEHPSSHNRTAVGLRKIRESHGEWDFRGLASLIADHEGYPQLSICRHSIDGEGADTVYGSISSLPGNWAWSITEHPCKATLDDIEMEDRLTTTTA